jgi:hypothetical protein
LVQLITKFEISTEEEEKEKEIEEEAVLIKSLDFYFYSFNKKLYYFKLLEIKM